MDLRKHIRSIPDFPKPGIMFRDVTTLLDNAPAFHYAIDQIYAQVKDRGIQKVVGIEARGFMMAGALAYLLGAGVTLVRKPGKLPYRTISTSYDLEYGSASVELHEDAIHPGDKVLLVDDLLATGGTMGACVELVSRLGAEINGIAFLIELTFLPGRKRLAPHEVISLVEYADENP